VDCLLVWTEDPAELLDEEQVRARWPEARQHRRLGPRLFLVDGVAARAGAVNGVAPTPASESPAQDETPRQQAEQALAAARQGSDRAQVVTALTDLGIVILSEGKARDSIAVFEEALTLARQLGDVDRESDIMGNLGMASLYVQQPVRARQLFEHDLAHARATGDILAEKVAMERMGLAASILGDPHGAVDWFERALELARRVGDQHQQANLLWLQAIQLAELNQRDAAITRAQDAIALFTKLGKPQASWYGAYLQKYRMGLFDTWPTAAPAGVGVAAGAESFLGGSLVAGVMAGPAPAQTQANPKGTTGPGLLRMALSASKAMSQFAGSGFKTTPPEVRRQRLQTCATCEHHTGMRCKICGCFTAAKSRLLQESCPIGKWPA
jgi:tetratricopeptide (TPR) repeat protein